MSEQTATTTTKTIDQHMADLTAWFEERNLKPFAVAQGKRSGQLAPIDDFLVPYFAETHTITFAVQVRK